MHVNTDVLDRLPLTLHTLWRLDSKLLGEGDWFIPNIHHVGTVSSQQFPRLPFIIKNTSNSKIRLWKIAFLSAEKGGESPSLWMLSLPGMT